jgi:hypothetical protein
MKRSTYRGIALAVGAVVLAAGGLAGCGGGGVEADLFDSRGMGTEFPLISFADQWGSALPRWWDIGDFGYSTTFRTEFNSAASGTITLRYDSAPTVPYFIGEIRAQGLKPNFCYQMKLMGKPGSSGGGLWGTAEDMAANETLLRKGRWWNYQTEDPAFTTTNDDAAVASADYQAGWVAGYLYFGYFVTNEYGNTNTDSDPATAEFIPIAANHSYHITGKSGQEGQIGEVPGTRQTISFTRGSYAYPDNPPSPGSVDLWLEAEPDDPVDVTLPAGTYDVVLMITEESFHADDDGGYWLTVRVSDWPTINSPGTGQPWVGGPGTPITFTVSGGGGTPTLTATVSVTLAKVGSKWQANAWVIVRDNNGAVISNATVKGNWSGAYTKTVSGKTGNDGIARFVTPRVSASSGSYFRFTVTNVVKSGYVWDGVQASDTEYVP